MVYTYSPTYYSSFQESMNSLCKSILLPFSLKGRRQLPADDQKLAKLQSDNLKWQQMSFHKILNLIGLRKEGMASEAEISAFRTELLDTLIASPKDQEPPGLIRDKLLFLQELLYAKCISADEYHSSKRPLLQRLAVQGVEIDCRDVVVGDPTATSEEEWSVIELRDRESPPANGKTKHHTPVKSLFNWKKGEGKKDTDTPEKRKPFLVLFNKEKRDDEANNNNNEKKKSIPDSKSKASKKLWGIDGLKKWKRSTHKEDELAAPSEDPLTAPSALVASPMGEGPDTRRIRNKIHSDGSSSDFFIDKVLGENIKKELNRIKAELSSTSPNLDLSDDQMEAISTRLPVDKADLNHFFPKSWCDQYGDVVLDVVKKEFKDHVGEMESLRNAAREKTTVSGRRWAGAAFEENGENCHPNNLFFRDRSWLNNPGTREANYNVNTPFTDE